MNNRLFARNLPHCQPLEFSAQGFSGPVSGIIYGPEAPPTNGMPLGGIDTGCLDIEASGNLGIMTMFNSFWPRRGPLNRPFLAVMVDGQTHVLTACGILGLKGTVSIDYWGHYPVLDMEFELEAPLSVGLRAWSPFIPGDIRSSMVPAAVFEIHLRNDCGKALQGTVAMSLPGFETYEKPLGTNMVHHRLVKGSFSGNICQTGGWVQPLPWGHAYALGVIGQAPVRAGQDFNADPVRWTDLGPTGNAPPPRAWAVDDPGCSVSVDFVLAAHTTKVVRFMLAWYAPTWAANGFVRGGGNQFTHMYAKHFGDINAVIEHMVGNHESLLGRVLAWQQVVYSEQQLPLWLRDSLINILHLITEDSVWAQAKPPIGDWCSQEDGLFGLNECPRSCPQMECLPCSFYGNLPLVYFFPKLVLSSLRGHKAYQFADGRPAMTFGGFVTKGPPEQAVNGYDMASPIRGYQESLNGCCLVEIVHKMCLRTDDQVLDEFYDMCKRATIYTMNLRPEYGDKQVVAMPAGDEGKEWFEAPEPGWRGIANHVGGVRLAHLQMMIRMAEKRGDKDFSQQCRRWLKAGVEAMEQYLWNGSYYLNYHKPETNESNDLVFGYQLDGQWMAKFHGLGGVFPAERVETTLQTIKKRNAALSKTGVVNYAQPDGSPAKVGGYGVYSYFPPELLMLAMTYMYAGRTEFGLELACRCWENITCGQRKTWNQPNTMRGDIDNGEGVFGQDYYQNMMLWSLPAAMAGQDLSGPLKPGGLVDRILKAANQTE